MDLDEESQRKAVVVMARKWIGTPYHSCADVLGVGVDCGMLIVRVMVDAGIVASFDPRPYPADWHLHRSEERYLGFVFDRTVEVMEPQLGDVAVFLYGRCYSHGGIVSKVLPLTVIHSFHQANMVLEEEISRNSLLSDKRRKPRFFSPWKRTVA